MPDYKSGTYLLNVKKPWCCLGCNKPINVGEKNFVRVKEHGDQLKRWDGQMYRQKDYSRWHIPCALALTDLDEFEKKLLGEYFKNVK